MSTAVTEKWVRVTKHNPCPICGKPDWCLASLDGKAAICERIESDRPVGSKGAGWLHKLDSDTPLLKHRHDGAPQARKAPPEVLDAAYRALLSELSISTPHRDNLHRRGLTDEEIDQLGYKTLPVGGRHELVRNLTAKGVELAGVPGFYHGGGYWQLAGPAGMLLPVKSVKSQIAGLQVRCNNAASGRYKWLSSKNFPEGCSPGTPVHVAGTVSVGGEVWITEGPLKADISALKLGRLVLAVAGVSNWLGAIPILRQLKPERVVIAFDMDKTANGAVRLHLDSLIAALIRRGIRTFEAGWDVTYKGIDDLLIGGMLCRT